MFFLAKTTHFGYICRMILRANCKINIGLDVLRRREDGFHELSTVMFPVRELYDPVTVEQSENLTFTQTGIAVDCPVEKNLCVRAARLMQKCYGVGNVAIELDKRVPFGAGLGGGSSDAAYMIRLLDERFRLNIGNAEMERYAARLGADCAFFITAEPSFASGIGNVLEPVEGPQQALEGCYIVVVKPDVAVSTRDAYSKITPRQPQKCCRDIVRQSIETWRNELVNDFEQPVFALYPQLAEIKEKLYSLGAVFALMSGSGSALFGIFRHNPEGIDAAFPDCATFIERL